jgi:hypothetical protein
MSLSVEESAQRRDRAVEAFNHHEQREDGGRVANSLADGLTQLREAFFKRVHDDVEKFYGMDSMLAALPSADTEDRVRGEIEIFQIVETATVATTRHYVHEDSSQRWFLDWLLELRLGETAQGDGVQQRIAHYLSKPPEKRGRSFLRAVDRQCPEASRAPLIIYRLYPLAIAVATSIAFSDSFGAAEVRNSQIKLLPEIADCQECHGRPIENGESCTVCGNPLWTYKWLTAAS